MANVLFVKSNDRPSDVAISNQMYHRFLTSYQEANPNDTITELNLFEKNLPYFGNDVLTGLYKESKGIDATDGEKIAADTANTYMSQFLNSDKIVFAFPLWNFTVPAPLINYVSYLSQAGKTFKYTSEGPVGLVGDKKVVLLSARGGDYSSEAMQALEMAQNYMKAILRFWGIHQPEVVVIEGHAQYADRAKDIIEKGLKETAEVAAAF
ncbi:FMN-dependent NADH-azoreductase [Paenibacillus sacheonensis]|uniref:FMN dependent NADH:quinone oxidoreductase n=1 Tax=Paenibacillus sacheonensis TaxID=742054 RepID=A0A7X4YUE5_9BACL|nr:FMN-dependent NADH-azoreductase [Paenibacillus sacheonensis]MBM7569076.1 FMN-dependent NADH-azoreductase [Paenibacillus sacheonensis]NBC72745.1 FMN-dependent NADH-azoreductase [Paenibacillus sacheonensis]